jgi:hypothetical protein
VWPCLQNFLAESASNVGATNLDEVAQKLYLAASDEEQGRVSNQEMLTIVDQVATQALGFSNFELCFF